MGHAQHAGDLRGFLKAGKKIIISTVQKFPFILEEIGSEHRRQRFAIIVDEATPKNKTLEVFGDPWPEGGEVKHRACHSYTMKQAIQEGFILDVLQHYTPVASYYRLAKKVEDDPEFDVKKGQKRLRKYVESHEHAIAEKAEIMVDHFYRDVLAKKKIGGQARAMVVTAGVQWAIDYFHAISSCLRERKSPYKAIVAFAGEFEYHDKKETTRCTRKCKSRSS